MFLDISRQHNLVLPQHKKEICRKVGLKTFVVNLCYFNNTIPPSTRKMMIQLVSQGLISGIFHTAFHFCLEGTPFSVPPNTAVLKGPTVMSIWIPVGGQSCLYTAPMHHLIFRDNSQCLFCAVLEAGLKPGIQLLLPWTHFSNANTPVMLFLKAEVSPWQWKALTTPKRYQKWWLLLLLIKQ